MLRCGICYHRGTATCIKRWIEITDEMINLRIDRLVGFEVE